MNRITVLSTACCAMFMPGFFTCLKDNGEREIRIIGVDMADEPFMGSYINHYYQVPAYTDNHYIDILIDICKKENVDIFFPHISMELPIVVDRIDSFREIGVRVAISDSKTLTIANNKYQLYEYMRKHGLKTPEYYHVGSIEELLSGAQKLGYPNKSVVVKVTENSGSRGVRIVRANISRSELFLKKKASPLDISIDEMCKTLEECNPIPDIMVMEYLPGCEYSVDLLASHGKTVYIAGRRNYESSMSIAMASFIEKKDEAYQLCEKIVSYLGLDGNIGFDFMLDENDNPVLTDLNPRVTATVILYKAGGLNLPYLRVKQLLGEDLPSINIHYGVKMKRRYLDLFN